MGGHDTEDVAIVLMGSAVMAPLVTSVGESAIEVELDARIPISYVTENGVEAVWVYVVYLASVDGRTDERECAAAFMVDEVWSGIGQEVYDYAMAYPAPGRRARRGRMTVRRSERIPRRSPSGGTVRQ